MNEKMNGQVGVISEMQANSPPTEQQNSMPPPDNRPPKKNKHNSGQI
jgi:hypothetical protein